MWGRDEPTAEAAVGYPRQDRRADLRRGRQDGRLRVPSYTHLSALVEQRRWFSTPYSEELWDIGRDRMQSELVACRRRVAPKHQLLAGLREQLETAKEDLERGIAALAEANAELTPDEVLPRNPQEAARSGDYRRSRRMLMREKRIRVEQERQARRIETVEILRQRISQTCEELDQDFAMAKDRANVLVEHTAMRVATYWGAVAAAHSEGRQLALLLPYLRRSLPTWLSATSRCGVLEPGPAEERPSDEHAPDSREPDSTVGP